MLPLEPSVGQTTPPPKESQQPHHLAPLHKKKAADQVEAARPNADQTADHQQRDRQGEDTWGPPRLTQAQRPAPAPRLMERKTQPSEKVPWHGLHVAPAWLLPEENPPQTRGAAPAVDRLPPTLHLENEEAAQEQLHPPGPPVGGLPAAAG